MVTNLSCQDLEDIVGKFEPSLNLIQIPRNLDSKFVFFFSDE